MKITLEWNRNFCALLVASFSIVPNSYSLIASAIQSMLLKPITITVTLITSQLNFFLQRYYGVYDVKSWLTSLSQLTTYSNDHTIDIKFNFSFLYERMQSSRLRIIREHRNEGTKLIQLRLMSTKLKKFTSQIDDRGPPQLQVANKGITATTITTTTNQILGGSQASQTVPPHRKYFWCQKINIIHNA